jgi:hypothetical protein
LVYSTPWHLLYISKTAKTPVELQTIDWGNHADVYLFRFLFGLVSGTPHLLFYISGTVKTQSELQTIDEWGNNVDVYLPKKASIWIGMWYSIALFITLKLHLQRVNREYLSEYICVSSIH